MGSSLFFDCVINKCAKDIPDRNDDLARETFFYECAKQALVLMANTCKFPPSKETTSLAGTMLKNKDHMNRLQAKANAINADRIARVEARKQRTLKKISAQVQKETLKQRTLSKKKRSQLSSMDQDEDGGEFDVHVADSDDENAERRKRYLPKSPLAKKHARKQRPGKARRIQRKNRAGNKK